MTLIFGIGKGGGNRSAGASPHPNNEHACPMCLRSFRDTRGPVDPESRDSGFDASRRPGMRNDDRQSHRADFKYLAVVTGLKGNTKLTAAVEFCHHRHHRDDWLASAILERAPHACLLAELDQVAGGRERQFESPALAACRSEEHTSELQSPDHLVCRLLLEKKKRI